VDLGRLGTFHSVVIEFPMVPGLLTWGEKVFQKIKGVGDK